MEVIYAQEKGIKLVSVKYMKYVSLIRREKPQEENRVKARGWSGGEPPTPRRPLRQKERLMHTPRGRGCAGGTARRPGGGGQGEEAGAGAAGKRPGRGELRLVPCSQALFGGCSQEGGSRGRVLGSRMACVLRFRTACPAPHGITKNW